MKKILKEKFNYYALFLFLIILIVVLAYLYVDQPGNEMSDISLPENFEINVFAHLNSKSLNLPGPNSGPRFMAIKDDVLFVSVSKQGKVVALPDTNNDGKADEIIDVITNLNRPHGLEFYKDWVYIAEEDKVIRVKDTNNDLVYETPEILIDNLPGGGHWTRTIKIFNEELYVSVGSSCNACKEKNKFRAAITKCDIDGDNCEQFATGLRNAVGFIFHPDTHDLIATENGRDLIGEDIPPEEINIIVEGKDYGWPICYGDRIHDTYYDKNVYIRNPCEDTEAPDIEFQSHSAPLGLAIYTGDQFPDKYEGKLFVAYHGSWNRKIPTGYKIVTMDLETKEVEDFATGWLTNDFKVLGRPVDVIVDNEGSLYISDDNAGLIYKVTYKN